MSETVAESGKKLRLLLVDDQYLFLESLKIVIESIAPDIEVAGTAENGEKAVGFVQQLSESSQNMIDAILMDVRMPVMDGVTASKIIHEKFPSVSIIMLTTFEDDEYVRNAMVNGAKGVFVKEYCSADACFCCPGCLRRVCSYGSEYCRHSDAEHSCR